MTETIRVPETIYELCGILEANGYPAYVVGGCVRDYFMHQTPHDWDITTSATTEEIAEVATRNSLIHVYPLQNALYHGVTFVHFKDMEVEIATFRRDGAYTGHNCTVTFDGVDIHEDLRRRDFTINAMAYRPLTGELIDDFNGQFDLEHHVLNCVGDTYRRFEEDPVRILRLFRFASKYDMYVLPMTLDAASVMVDGLANISKERIRNEFEKILLTRKPGETIMELNDMGAMEYIVPDYYKMVCCEQNNPYHMYTVEGHALKVVDADNHPTAILRWAELLHDIGKPDTKETINGVDHFYGHAKESAKIANITLHNLNYSRDFIEEVTSLISHHDGNYNLKTIRKFAGKYGIDWLKELYTLKYCDMMGQKPCAIIEKAEEMELLKQNIDMVEHETPAIVLRNMNINGNDIITLTGKAGPLVGKVLDYCFDLVIENPNCNNHDDLMLIAQNYLTSLQQTK